MKKIRSEPEFLMEEMQEFLVIEKRKEFRAVYKKLPVV